MEGHLTAIFAGLVAYRRRLLALAALYLVLAGLALAVAGEMMAFICRPAGELTLLRPAEAAVYQLMLAALLAAVVLAPLAVYVLMSPLAVRLGRRGRWQLAALTVLSWLFGMAGGLFAYTVLVPASFQFLMGFATGTIQPMLSLDGYLRFVLGLVLPSALFFQLPLVIVLLGRFGLVSPGGLARGRKYALLIALILAAILTPPDVVSQIMLTGPILGLYELGILCLRLTQPRRAA